MTPRCQATRETVSREIAALGGVVAVVVAVAIKLDNVG